MSGHDSEQPRLPGIRLEPNTPLRDDELDGERVRELNDELNALFAASWPGHELTDFCVRLRRSLLWVAAFRQGGAGAGSDTGDGPGARPYREGGHHPDGDHGRRGDLVGFVNVVGDGGVHAFVLDTTVHPSVRRQGVGVRLVTRAADEARRAGARWLHVDYEEQLGGFYARCGFRPTAAGVRRLE